MLLHTFATTLGLCSTFCVDDGLHSGLTSSPFPFSPRQHFIVWPMSWRAIPREYLDPTANPLRTTTTARRDRELVVGASGSTADRSRTRALGQRGHQMATTEAFLNQGRTPGQEQRRAVVVDTQGIIRVKAHRLAVVVVMVLAAVVGTMPMARGGGQEDTPARLFKGKWGSSSSSSSSSREEGRSSKISPLSKAVRVRVCRTKVNRRSLSSRNRGSRGRGMGSSVAEANGTKIRHALTAACSGSVLCVDDVFEAGRAVHSAQWLGRT